MKRKVTRVGGSNRGATIHLKQSPRIFIVEKFLTNAQCEHLIQLAQNKLQRSLGLNLDTGQSAVTEIRTSSHCWLGSAQDHIVAEIEQRIAKVTNIPVENGEPFSILRYELGQEYKAHHDYFDPDWSGSVTALEDGGQRITTVLLYLSDVEEGGETVFPLVNVSVKPRKGSLLCFSNVQADGSIDLNSLHAGLPVTKGEKWLATKWLRKNARRVARKQKAGNTSVLVTHQPFRHFQTQFSG